MDTKKHYIMIAFSHLAAIISLFFPLINVNEQRIGAGGFENTESYFINIISYVRNEIYPLTGICLMVIMIIAIMGIVNAIVGIFSKKINNTSAKMAFVFGFSSAICAALLLYSNSVLLFSILASSFALISFASIKLLMAEEKQSEQKGE
jgi:hypothetical protein